jgi:hypothetical protein
MKPITSQDTKWTRLQTIQGPKQNSRDLDVYQRDQLVPRDILAAQDSMIFQSRFRDLNGL